MSRAFVKEGSGELEPLPDLPISPHPNYVTARGLQSLRVQLAEAQATLSGLRARPDRLDKMPEAAAERDIRYLEARLKTAILVDIAAQGTETVAFGHAVTVVDDQGRSATYEITGEDEAAAAQGRIAPQSPLARALLGASVGDVVTWKRPSGAVELEVQAIRCPA